MFLLVVFAAPQQETTLASPRRTSRKPLPGPTALGSLRSPSLRRPRKGRSDREEPNYRTNFTPANWVQERNKKQGKDSALTGAAVKPEVQWIEAEMSFGSKPRCAGNGMDIEFLGGGARLRVRDERDAELAAVMLRAMGGGAC